MTFVLIGGLVLFLILVLAVIYQLFNANSTFRKGSLVLKDQAAVERQVQREKDLKRALGGYSTDHIGVLLAKKIEEGKSFVKQEKLAEKRRLKHYRISARRYQI